jgi:hypothetical protein
VAVVPHPQRHDREPPVPEVEQVLGGGARGAAVVDRDERHAGDVGGVADDQRQVPLERGGHARVVGWQRVDEARVDERRPDRRGVGGAVDQRCGEEGEGDAELLGLDGEAAKRGHGGRIGERVGQPLGEQHADRAGPAGAQGPTGRVGPRVAELGREREDLLAQRRVELVGAVEGVRRGGAGDAEPVGEGLQRHPVSHVVTSLLPAATLRTHGRMGERRLGERVGAGDVELGEGGEVHGASFLDRLRLYRSRYRPAALSWYG